MIGNLSSGNMTVDEMAAINISGNVIPQVWYKTITRENGKPYLMAIAILADIVYWYRPTEVRDEQTGCTVRWQKKFRGDYLQKNYKAYEEQFGETKRVVKCAVDRLIELGVVDRILRDIKSDSGTLHNVMYFSLNVERLKQLTFPEEYPVEMPGNIIEFAGEPVSDGNLLVDNGREKDMSVGNAGEDSDFGHYVQSESPDPAEHASGTAENGWSQICKDMVTNLSPYGTGNVTTSSQECNHLPTNLLPRGTGNVMTSSQECDHMVTDLSGRGHGNVGTNTKITTETTTQTTTGNTTEITSIMDGMDDIHPSNQGEDPETRRMKEDIEAVRRNIDFDNYIAHCHFTQVEEYKELFSLICDTLCVRAAYLTIGGQQVPYFRVREKMLSLRREHLEYVLECMRKTTGRIGNIQAYLVKCLFNAPSTIDSWNSHEAIHDIYGGAVSGYLR